MSSKEIEYSYERINLLIEEFNRIKERIQEIQGKYTFKIPTYILDEIARSEGRHREDNIIALINLAVINNRLTKEQAKTLKNEFSNR